MEDHQQQEEEPPFALVEPNSPQHLFMDRSIGSPSPRAVTQMPNGLMKMPNTLDSQGSQASPAPGLMMESVLTDCSSSGPSLCDSHIMDRSNLPYLDTSSAFLDSSLPTVSSVIGNSSQLPDSRVFGQHEVQPPITTTLAPKYPSIAASGGGGSIRFSQLMRAADDTAMNMRHSRMDVVPEDGIVESSHDMVMQSGTLISSPTEQPGRPSGDAAHWIQTLMTAGYQPNNSTANGMAQPLLPTAPSQDEAVLISTNEAAMIRAKSTVTHMLEDDQSFEVSMRMNPDCTIQDVMEVLADPALLKVWCDPIQTLIVTSSSDGVGESTRGGAANRDREYEGEWIEATTTALESPASNLGYIYSAGQAVLSAIGIGSYGKITMFVERKRGQVGLTVGPFSGGINASHTISVYEEGGRVRIIDRVRLTKDGDEISLSSLFLCGMLDACLSSCLLPSIGGYVDQVTTSLARLRLLVEQNQLSSNLIVDVPR